MVDVFFVSSDVWAKVAIFTHFYLYVDPVWLVYNVGTGCILGRSPRTMETLPDFH